LGELMSRHDDGAMGPNRWLLLAVAVGAQSMTTWLANAPIFLIAHLHLDRQMSLADAGLLASTALAGGTVALIAWGVVVDRIGERKALLLGLTLATVAGLASAAASDNRWLAVTWFGIGVGTASMNSASGRLIVGWFPPSQRGTAMGVRQTALPLGAGFAAFAEPVLAADHGLRAAMLVPSLAVAIALLAVFVVIVDPPRVDVATAAAAGQLANPYRGDRRLLRIHAASVLLVVPQFTVWTFIVVWLIDGRGWTTAAAGALAAVTQILGALGRVGAGWWSDRVRSRLRPIRVIAVAAALTMFSMGIVESTPLAVALMVAATIITVADNGLAFTAVAEIAGPYWSGRAMGMQNTGQYLAAAAVPPAVGALIADRGYGFAFALVALFPILAIAVVPNDTNRPGVDVDESAAVR
jgi:sugar phosphate permease